MQLVVLGVPGCPPPSPESRVLGKGVGWVGEEWNLGRGWEAGKETPNKDLQCTVRELVLMEGYEAQMWVGGICEQVHCWLKEGRKTHATLDAL